MFVLLYHETPQWQMAARVGIIPYDELAPRERADLQTLHTVSRNGVIEERHIIVDDEGVHHEFGQNTTMETMNLLHKWGAILNSGPRSLLYFYFGIHTLQPAETHNDEEWKVQPIAYDPEEVERKLPAWLQSPRFRCWSTNAPLEDILATETVAFYIFVKAAPDPFLFT